MVNRYEAFLAAISCIHRSIQRLERVEMAQYGLQAVHAQYLIVLQHYPNGITLTDLAAVCEKDKAALSRRIPELIACGLVRRADISTGHRAPLLLTEKGRQAAAQLMQAAELAVDQAGQGLTVDQRESYFSALSCIAANLQRISQQGLYAD